MLPGSAEVICREKEICYPFLLIFFKKIVFTKGEQEFKSFNKFLYSQLQRLPLNDAPGSKIY
jgi:hypothetical protein